MSIYSKGMKVKRKNGGLFSNDKGVATVDYVSESGRVYFKETGTWLFPKLIKPVKATPLDEAIALLERMLKENEERVERVKEAIKTLKEIDINE